MEEQKLIERSLMSEEEFSEYIDKNRVDIYEDFYKKQVLYLRSYEGLNKYRSIRRAIRRGLVSIDGFVYPKRPFHNAKCHKHSINYRKKVIYEQLKGHTAR